VKFLCHPDKHSTLMFHESLRFSDSYRPCLKFAVCTLIGDLKHQRLYEVYKLDTGSNFSMSLYARYSYDACGHVTG
jgi:hypothetical protein